MEKLLSTGEVVERLKNYGVTTSAGVGELVRKEELFAIKEKGRYQFRPCDIEEYIWARQGSRKLLEIPFFKEIIENEKVGPSIKSFFGDDPGLIIAIMPGGFVFSIVLLSHLVTAYHCNVMLTEMKAGKNSWSRNEINGKRILLVDGITREGKTLNRIKSLFLERNDIKLKGIKIFVWGDFSGSADYWVYRPKYEDRLNSFQINLL